MTPDELTAVLGDFSDKFLQKLTAILDVEIDKLSTRLVYTLHQLGEAIKADPPNSPLK